MENFVILATGALTTLAVPTMEAQILIVIQQYIIL